MSTLLSVGQLAPTFCLPATGGQKMITLSDFIGRPIVLYFYPKDNTPGCTLESQQFRDHYNAFLSLNSVIFGISRDSMTLHEKFKQSQALPFELLSDMEGTVCQAYNVIKPKNLYGKQVQSLERSTFLIDTQGRLVHSWRKVKVEGHVLEVLEATRSISDKSGV